MVNGTIAEIGANKPCHCGSGKKYKKCCRKQDRKNSNSSKIDTTVNINEMNDLIADNPSIKEMKDSLEGMKTLKSTTETGLLNVLTPFCLDKEELCDTLSKIGELEEQFSQFDIPDKFNEHFLKHGWIAHESIDDEAMQKAVELAEESKFEEAEDILIDIYTENLELSIQMILHMEEMRPRKKLLELSYEDYLAERYHSCILLLFTIIDGFVVDTKEIDGNKCFFAKGEELYAWDSIAAHKTGLNELRKILYQNRSSTNAEEIDIPYRNGIMHGRDLSFANKKVAIKLWATLFSLRDGIIAIKKGKNPKKTRNFDLMKELQDNKIRQSILNDWKPRILQVNVNFPESGDPSEYQDESPEKTLVEFFEGWKNENYGLMVQKLNHRFFEEETPGKRVNELKTGIFENKQIENYSIINITDDSAIITDIKVNLTIHKEDNEVSKEINFRIIYEREDGEMELRGMGNGSWNIYNGIYDLEDHNLNIY